MVKTSTDVCGRSRILRQAKPTTWSVRRLLPAPTWTRYWRRGEPPACSSGPRRQSIGLSMNCSTSTIRASPERSSWRFGHLRFSTLRGRIVFDVLLSELHSLPVGELGTAIDVWHGDKRHQVSLAGPPEIMLPSQADADPVLGAIAVTGGVRQFRRERRGPAPGENCLSRTSPPIRPPV
jgi:hypothetical protein